jgi:hypothetical protein
VIRGADQRESPVVNDCLYGRVGRQDAGPESRVDQSADRVALPWGYDRDERPLGSVRLDADERATRHEVLPCSREGMDHALDGDSSK